MTLRQHDIVQGYDNCSYLHMYTIQQVKILKNFSKLQEFQIWIIMANQAAPDQLSSA